MNVSSLKPYLSLLKQKFAEKKDKPFFKGGLGSLVIKFGNTFLQFGVGVILARTLGVEAFGIYTFIYAIIKIIAIPTELGLPNLLIRFIPRYNVNEEWGQIKGLLKFTNGAVLTISLVVIFASFLLVYTEIFNFSAAKSHTFFWGLALLPILALGNIRGASLRGFRYFILGLIPESLLRHAFFIVLLVTFFFINSNSLSASEAMAYHVVAAAGGYIIGAYWLIKYMPVEVRKAMPLFEIKKWTTVAGPFLLIGGVQIIMGKIDVVLLGVLRNSAEVGIYEVAYKAAGLLFFGLNAINFIVGPYFSRYYGYNQIKELQKIATFSAVSSSVIAFFIAIFLIIFGSQLLEIVFGLSYKDSYSPMLILIATQFVVVLSGSVVTLLNMTGFENRVLLTMVVAATLNIVLNLVFIPLYGVEGAALTSLITTIVMKTYLVYISIQKVKVDPTVLYIMKFLYNKIIRR